MSRPNDKHDIRRVIDLAEAEARRPLDTAKAEDLRRVWSKCAGEIAAGRYEYPLPSGYSFAEEIALEYQNQRADRPLIVDPDKAPDTSGAPASTVDALMFCLREGGIVALEEPANLQRLTKLSPAQFDDVIKRLSKLRSQYPAITDELLQTIKGCRG
jgi:hypothetical protein